MRNQTLNFSDLQRAMNNGLGGLGQDSLSNIPLTGQVGETPTDQAISNAMALSLPASVSSLNWGLLGACVVGLFLFVELTSKK